MRSASPNTVALLTDAPEGGISTRDFVFFRLVDGVNTFGFYNDIDPSVSVDVIDGQTGSTVARTYEGAGALQNISDIPLTVGLNIYKVTVNLSNIHPTVQNMVRGYNLRNAWVEIHRGLIDPATGRLVDPPMLHFMGTVNQANPRRPGGIAVTVTSITNELTRTNPALFSDATIRRRGGDRFLRYADIMGDVKVTWGADPMEVAKPPKRKKFLGLF